MMRSILIIILSIFMSQLFLSCGNKSEFIAGQNEQEVTDGSLSHRDFFVQTTGVRPKVDILWVVDNSGSMQDEQEAIAANFETFINGFVAEDIDFKMAIITTDTNEQGTPVNPLDSLTLQAATDNMDEFIYNFRDYINVGIYGDRDEKGLESINLFLDNHGTNFLRDGAHFEIIVVSDEEDHTSEPLYTSFESSVKSYKPGSESLIKFFSIVGIGNYDTRFNGERYLEQTEIFGGLSANITSDFHTTLKSLGEMIVDLTDSFALAHIPINDELVVSVNGVPIIGYSYDTSTRTVKFDSDSVPSRGDIITIDYRYMP